jgi:hypothetical protein
MASGLLKSTFYRLATVALLAVSLTVGAAAQESNSAPVFVEPGKLTAIWPGFSPAVAGDVNHGLAAPIFLRGFSFLRPPAVSSSFLKPLKTNNLSTIGRMEAAFYCNDTPFIDQVRLPLATLWGGRLKLVGFESDVTTANFVLGLPGGGTLPNLSMMGSGHLAMHTPPSDQLTGIHLTINLRGSGVEGVDNSGLHGLQYVVRAGRGFLQSVGNR